MDESDLQSIYNYLLYPRDSKIFSDKEFAKTDNGSQVGNHWVCFIIKDKKSFYFDSFVGQTDKFLLKQIPRPR